MRALRFVDERMVIRHGGGLVPQAPHAEAGP
jgi:hypothetical protein